MRLIAMLFLMIYFVNSHAQKKIFLDANGNEIKERIYRKKWANNDSLYSAWAYKGKGGKTYYTLKKDLYLKAVFNYQNVKQELEKLINKSIPTDNTILIKYNYKDDLCASHEDNKSTQSNIKDVKNFSDPLRDIVETNNLTYIVLFETGISLKNKLTNENEFYFIDSNGYFRNTFFKNPSICGSFSLTKPNGQTVIRNGEYRADWMANHLKQKNWSYFFKNE